MSITPDDMVNLMIALTPDPNKPRLTKILASPTMYTYMRSTLQNEKSPSWMTDYAAVPIFIDHDEPGFLWIAYDQFGNEMKRYPE